VLLLNIPNTFWNGFEVVNINIYYIKNFFKLKNCTKKVNAPLQQSNGAKNFTNKVKIR
jgi:hypothetical protein